MGTSVADPERLMAAAGGIFLMALVTVIGLFAVRSSRNKIAEVAGHWQAFAAAHGCAYEPVRTHVLGAWPPKIAGAWRGVGFRGTFHLGGGGQTQVANSAKTEFSRAPQGLPRPVSMRVLPRGVASFGMGKGMPTGDAQFDRRFVVLASNTHALSVLGPRFRAMLCRLDVAGRDVTFDLNHGYPSPYVSDKCTLTLEGLQTDPACLELAIDALAAAGQ